MMGPLHQTQIWPDMLWFHLLISNNMYNNNIWRTKVRVLSHYKQTAPEGWTNSLWWVSVPSFLPECDCCVSQWPKPKRCQCENIPRLVHQMLMCCSTTMISENVWPVLVRAICWLICLYSPLTTVPVLVCSYDLSLYRPLAAWDAYYTVLSWETNKRKKTFRFSSFRLNVFHLLGRPGHHLTS